MKRLPTAMQQMAMRRARCSMNGRMRESHRPGAGAFATS